MHFAYFVWATLLSCINFSFHLHIDFNSLLIMRKIKKYAKRFVHTKTKYYFYIYVKQALQTKCDKGRQHPKTFRTRHMLYRMLCFSKELSSS